MELNNINTDTEETKKCQHDWCENKGTEPHTCPYQVEIYEEETTLCNCCESCQHECAMDV